MASIHLPFSVHQNVVKRNTDAVLGDVTASTFTDTTGNLRSAISAKQDTITTSTTLNVDDLNVNGEIDTPKINVVKTDTTNTENILAEFRLGEYGGVSNRSAIINLRSSGQTNDCVLQFGTPYTGTQHGGSRFNSSNPTEGYKGAIVFQGLNSHSRQKFHVCLDNIETSNQTGLNAYDSGLTKSKMSVDYDGNIVLQGGITNKSATLLIGRTENKEPASAENSYSFADFQTSKVALGGPIVELRHSSTATNASQTGTTGIVGLTVNAIGTLINGALVVSSDNNISTVNEGKVTTRVIRALDANQLRFENSDSVTRMRMDSAGRFGINTQPETFFKIKVNGAIKATAALDTTSDDRLKYNEVDISSGSALQAICQLAVKEYDKIKEHPSDPSGTWIPTDEEWAAGQSENFTTIKEIGVIAQEMKQIPMFASYVTGEEVDASGTQTPLAVTYQALLCTSISAVQELKTQVETLKAEVETLKGEVEGLK